MEIKLVKVINIIGKTAIVNIDGEKIRANVEGKIPSYTFFGEIIKEKDKLIIRVRNDIILSKDITNILQQLELPKTSKNYLITKLLMTLSLPIVKEHYRTIENYKLPSYLISVLIVKNKPKYEKKYLSIVEALFKEYSSGKVSEKEIAIFLNSLISPKNEEEFRIFWIEGKEKWFSEIEFNEDGFKKIVMTTKIEDIEVLVIFEKHTTRYNLTVNFFSERNLYLPVKYQEELKQNLEALGFNPIYIYTEVFNEKSSST